MARHVARPFGVDAVACGSVVEWHLSGSGLSPPACGVLCPLLTSRVACAGGISPDKNANCSCATSAFTSEPEPWALVCGATLPDPSALYAVSVRRLTVLNSGFLSTVGYLSAVAFV